MAMLISFMGLSSAATRLDERAPQRRQRWMTAHSPPLRDPDGHGVHDAAAVGGPDLRAPRPHGGWKGSWDIGCGGRCPPRGGHGPPADLAGESLSGRGESYSNRLVLLALCSRFMVMILQKVI
jgi:hypothetical protein